MVPYLFILIIAVIGAFIGGVGGFITFGAIGLIGVLIIGWIVGKMYGGMLPRKVRYETAEDFIVKYPDLVMDAYPSLRAHERKERVAKILDDMFKRANSDNPSMNVGNAGHPDVFIPSALQVANEQPSHNKAILAEKLVDFVKNHRLWYGDR